MRAQQFKMSYYNLVFADNNTLYHSGRELPHDPLMLDWFNKAAINNILYSNRDTDSLVFIHNPFAQNL